MTPSPEQSSLVERWLQEAPDACLIWHDGNSFPSLGAFDADGWAWLHGSPFDTSVIEARFIDASIPVARLFERLSQPSDGVAVTDEMIDAGVMAFNKCETLSVRRLLRVAFPAMLAAMRSAAAVVVEKASAESRRR